MPKEVIDILPPRKNEESKIVSLKVSAKEPGRKSRKKKLFFFVVLILIIGAIGYGQVFSRVEIEILPKMETFESALEMTVDEKINQTDLISRIIPGYSLKEQNSLSQQFSSSGKIIEDKKAEGTIKIFNDFSALSLPLRENTRFMAASGQIFRTPARIIVPGNKTETGKTIPGSIDVKVIAEGAGPEYNIEPTTFSIPGLAGTPSYTKIYGKSSESMSGGFKGETPQVTREDLEKAEVSVIEKLKQGGEQVLIKKSTDSGSVFLREIFQQEVKATSSSVEVGAEVSNFDFSATVESTALLFKNEDMIKLITIQLPGNKKIYEKTLNTDWTIGETDLNKGKASLELRFKGSIYADISKLNLEKELKGKTLIGAKDFLGKKSEISEVKISSWPFWIKKIPGNTNKTEIKLRLD